MSVSLSLCLYLFVFLPFSLIWMQWMLKWLKVQQCNVFIKPSYEKCLIKNYKNNYELWFALIVLLLLLSHLKVICNRSEFRLKVFFNKMYQNVAERYSQPVLRGASWAFINCSTKNSNSLSTLAGKIFPSKLHTRRLGDTAPNEPLIQGTYHQGH